GSAHFSRRGIDEGLRFLIRPPSRQGFPLRAQIAIVFGIVNKGRFWEKALHPPGFAGMKGGKRLDAIVLQTNSVRNRSKCTRRNGPSQRELPARPEPPR